MKSVYKYTALLFLLLSFCTCVQAAPGGKIVKQEFSKSIKKNFGIASDGTVALSNKYGKMDVKTWEQNRVKIDIRITVNAVSERAAQEVFERIEIEFSDTDNYISAETQINSNTSNWWNGWTSSKDKSDFQIDWEVFMPASVTLDLSNKYGDVYVAALDGNANVEVKYGNFRLDGIGEKLKVNLGYGNGTVVSATDTEAEISYSNFKMQEVFDVTFESKYSKITVDEAKDLRINSGYDTYTIGSVRDLHTQGKYDNYSIGTADNLIAVSRYSDFNIGTLKNSADFDLTYGGARIGKILRGFSEMRLLGRYADYKMTVEEGASYTLDADAEYAGIRYPRVMRVDYEKDRGTSHQVEGYVNTKGARSVIKARLDYGGLKVD